MQRSVIRVHLQKLRPDRRIDVLHHAQILLAHLAAIGIAQRRVLRRRLCAEQAIRQNRLKLPRPQLCPLHAAKKILSPAPAQMPSPERHALRRRSSRPVPGAPPARTSYLTLIFRGIAKAYRLLRRPFPQSLERETGIEPATNSLEGCDSTTELLPPDATGPTAKAVGLKLLKFWS